MYVIDVNVKTERHGSEYGGWNIIKNSLSADSVVLSFGIGNDISFDLSVIQKYGCKVLAFDPTPTVAEWVSSERPPDELKFFSVGISDSDANATFYKPENPTYISHTQRPTSGSVPVEVPVRRLSSIMMDNDLQSIDLLKLDIEGFEYSVIDDIIASQVFPTQLLVEFHHFMPEYSIPETETAIDKLKAYGYLLFDVSDSFCEFAFTRKP